MPLKMIELDRGKRGIYFMDNSELTQGLYGSFICKNKMVGFCQYHQAALTVKTMKNHECLKKQCNAFKKCPEHDFWRQHEQKKIWRKENKKSSGVSEEK